MVCQSPRPFGTLTCAGIWAAMGVSAFSLCSQQPANICMIDIKPRLVMQCNILQRMMNYCSATLIHRVLTGCVHEISVFVLIGIEHCQGLQVLYLSGSRVSSLHPLAALGSLRHLCISVDVAVTSLAGLEGSICTCLQSLKLESCYLLRQLSGIEGLSALERLGINCCSVTSLQPVGQLVGGLRWLSVEGCCDVREEVLNLPHIPPTADVRIVRSNVKEVVLAGGVRRHASGRSTTETMMLLARGVRRKRTILQRLVMPIVFYACLLPCMFLSCAKHLAAVFLSVV